MSDITNTLYSYYSLKKCLPLLVRCESYSSARDMSHVWRRGDDPCLPLQRGNPLNRFRRTPDVRCKTGDRAVCIDVGNAQ